VTILIKLMLYIVQITPVFFSLNPLPTPLKAIQEVSLFYFIKVYKVHLPYAPTLILHSPSPLPLVSLHTLYLFYSLVFHY
jgi:hypothetical protein